MNVGVLPRLEPAGIDGYMVRLFDTIDEDNLAWLSALSRDCETAFGQALVDLVPSYTTLLVIFDPLQISAWQARIRLSELLARLTPDPALAGGKLHDVATWYHPEVGPDLARVAELSSLTEEAVIKAHSEREYRVFALGFSPGFAFMGLLDSSLTCPRLDTPRSRVPRGSVAIAGQQTAVYPTVTPGGWNLIGRTAARLFDRDRDGFSLMKVGDRVRFVAVDRNTFESEGGDPTPVSPTTKETR
ncbi:5-oxoprolinase subunit PxpB [Marinobacter confluentis]|uniref:5-oxoprolinase subunit PxpB n=1 Tax=Marinobacter confluentis TaxID=1697557 RepID=A0A4Z1C179_9GAMM|nr:5-oxoprolinase subunit PxpB [Marinobacter confluentis]TGN38742.1 5-oxoprolinase subunit PxpB [Marinobacter confluentis]